MTDLQDNTDLLRRINQLEAANWCLRERHTSRALRQKDLDEERAALLREIARLEEENERLMEEMP